MLHTAISRRSRKKVTPMANDDNAPLDLDAVNADITQGYGDRTALKGVVTESTMREIARAIGNPTGQANGDGNNQAGGLETRELVRASQPNADMIIARSKEATSEVHVYVLDQIAVVERKIMAIKELLEETRRSVEARNEEYVRIADELVGSTRQIDTVIERLGRIVVNHHKTVSGRQ